jgi:pimeloyl-ACP methyl ester carboxylesterase
VTDGLFVEDEGSGPAVLLLHGQPGEHSEFAPLAPRLGSGFRIISIDRFGYGRSIGPARSMVEQADSYAALLSERAATPAVIVGYSFGGGIALLMAARHPDQVAGLVLVGSVGGTGSVTAGDRLLATPLIGPALSAVLLVAYARLGPLAARVTRSSVLAGNVPARSQAMPPSIRRAFAEDQRALVAESPVLGESVSRVRCPATVIAGDRDLIVPDSSARDLAERLAHARLVIVNGLGHLLVRDQPQVVADAVLEMLDQG